MSHSLNLSFKKKHVFFWFSTVKLWAKIIAKYFTMSKKAFFVAWYSTTNPNVRGKCTVWGPEVLEVVMVGRGGWLTSVGRKCPLQYPTHTHNPVPSPMLESRSTFGPRVGRPAPWLTASWTLGDALLRTSQINVSHSSHSCDLSGFSAVPR